MSPNGNAVLPQKTDPERVNYLFCTVERGSDTPKAESNSRWFVLATGLQSSRGLPPVKGGVRPLCVSLGGGGS